MMLVLDLFVIVYESLLNNLYQNQFTDEFTFVHEKSFFKIILLHVSRFKKYILI